MLSLIHLEECLLGDSKSSRVDNADEPSQVERLDRISGEAECHSREPNGSLSVTMCALICTCFYTCVTLTMCIHAHSHVCVGRWGVHVYVFTCNTRVVMIFAVSIVCTFVHICTCVCVCVQAL
jgi:hypothetical protein